MKNNLQKTNEGICIYSEIYDEKIRFFDEFILICEEVKNYLNEVHNSKNYNELEEFEYQMDLEIIFDDKQNNKFKTNKLLNLDLTDDKIANLILEKRKKLLSKYSNIIFKFGIIKDIKINILMQIILEEYFKDNEIRILKDILYSDKYKFFAVSCAHEINRNFITLSCFA